MLLSDEELKEAWDALYFMENEGWLDYGTAQYRLYEKLTKYFKEQQHGA